MVIDSIFVSYALGRGAFLVKHSKEIAKITPLEYYPTVSIVVPAHNEEAVIQKTSRAILNLNYPADKVEILIFADNCTDRTAELAEAVGNQAEYQKRQFKVVRRTGEGGKSGVLNDALKMIHSDYLCVYDADATTYAFMMPMRCLKKMPCIS